jgi:predicted PurR-regulated permease PerM
LFAKSGIIIIVEYMITRNTNEKQKQQAAFILLLVIAMLLFYFLIDFLVPFLGAVILHQVLKGFMWRLTDNLGFNKTLAALLIMLASLLVITMPILYLVNMLYGKFMVILADENSLINNLDVINNAIKDYLGIDIISAENMEMLKTKAANMVPSVLNKIVTIAVHLLVMYFILYYMLVHHKEIPVFLKSFLPFSKNTTELFLKELESMTRANVIGVPILAVIQSIAAALAFYFLQAPEPFFWGIMCGIFSFIPFIGSAIIWLPMAVYMYLMGLTWQGIVVLVYGAIVISNIDNVFRMYIQKYFANVHPLITVFGVIFGLQVFGLPGLIFGPLLISYFITGVKIYRKSYINSM